MSEASANVKIVEAVYDAFRRRDIPAVLQIFAPDVVIEQSRDIPWGGRYEGQDQALIFFANLTQAIRSTVRLDSFVDSGDRVVALGRTQGTVNASGAPFDVPVAHVWAIENGLVRSVLFCIDNPTMLAALA